MIKTLLGIALLVLIVPASAQAEESSSCGWLHYAAGGLTVAGAAASTNGSLLISTAASSVTSGFMFCGWWSKMTALNQEQVIYVVYNHSSILKEAPRGIGPHVEALASLHGCSLNVRKEFGSMLRRNVADNTEMFSEYSKSPAGTMEFLSILQHGIQKDPILSMECNPTG